MARLRALVIGRGYMGSNHERVLRGHGVETISVDPDPRRGADYPRLRYAPPADLALVSVPPGELAPVARRALRRARRVVVDKPMAASREESRSLVETASGLGVELLVVFTERANPGFRALREHLSLVGPVRSITARRLGPPPRNWSCDPGVDLAGHCFDIVRALGFEPSMVAGECTGGTARYTAEIGGGALDVRVSHGSAARLRTLAVAGTEGKLVLDQLRQTVLFHNGEGGRRIPVRQEEPLQIVWREVLEGSWPATGADGEIALSMSLARADMPQATLREPGKASPRRRPAPAAATTR